MKTKNQKGFAGIAFIVVIAAIILTGGYWWFKKNNQQSYKSTVTTTVDASSWKTYIDTQNRFQLQYPPNWNVQGTMDLSILLLVYSTNKFDVSSIYRASCKNSDWTQNSNGVFIKTICLPNMAATINMQANSSELEKLEDQILSTFKFTK